MEAEKVIRVSTKNSPGYYVNQGRIILETHSVIELQGLGSSTSVTVNAACRLCDLNYAVLKKFHTTSFEENGRNVFKASVTLEKSPEFDKVNEEFLKSRQREN